MLAASWLPDNDPYHDEHSKNITLFLVPLVLASNLPGASMNSMDF